MLAEERPTLLQETTAAKDASIMNIQDIFFMIK
jgi:hypothetical protein